MRLKKTQIFTRTDCKSALSRFLHTRKNQRKKTNHNNKKQGSNPETPKATSTKYCTKHPTWNPTRGAAKPLTKRNERN